MGSGVNFKLRHGSELELVYDSIACALTGDMSFSSFLLQGHCGGGLKITSTQPTDIEHQNIHEVCIAAILQQCFLTECEAERNVEQ